ncbi:MAG TPA: DsbC family protein [Bordetella sp.]
MTPAFLRKLVAVLCTAAAAALAPAVHAADPAAAMMSTAAVSADPAAEAVQALFHERFPDLDVSRVRRTPYGLYEVQVGMDMVYTDEKVSWVLQGQLVDAMTRRDVTRESLAALGDIPFDKLPLALAVKQVKGNGKRKVAIFEDPNCIYCKQLRHTLQQVSDVTIYTFLYAILAPDSADKSRTIWCSKDPAGAWDDWMLHGKMPASANCDAPIDKVLALGKQLMVRGTPTLYFGDGTHTSGALPLNMLQARLDGRDAQQ